MIDSSDKNRLGEAHEELMKLMNEKELKDATLLILANKQVFKSLFLFRLNMIVIKYIKVFLKLFTN